MKALHMLLAGLIVAAAMTLLAGCGGSGETEAVSPAGSGSSVGGGFPSYTLVSGTAPTDNGDGSVSFGATAGTVVFDSTLGGINQASASALGQFDGSTQVRVNVLTEYITNPSGFSGGYVVEIQRISKSQLDILVANNNGGLSAVTCPTKSIAGTYNLGDTVQVDVTVNNSTPSVTVDINGTPQFDSAADCGSLAGSTLSTSSQNRVGMLGQDVTMTDLSFSGS